MCEAESGLIPVGDTDRRSKHVASVLKFSSTLCSWMTLLEVCEVFAGPQDVEGEPRQQQVQPLVGGSFLHQAHDAVREETEPSNGGATELKEQRRSQ